MAIGLIANGVFFWNLTANVGKGAPNKLDDVDLVRYGYKCMAANPLSQVAQSVKDAIKEMKPAGAYGPDLQKVIDAHQKDRGGTQDGVVSVAKITATNKARYDNAHTWIMFVLNVNINEQMKGEWPRIDKDDRLGPNMKATSKQTFWATSDA